MGLNALMDTPQVTGYPLGERALSRKEAARLVGYRPKTLANLATLDQGPPVRKHNRRVLYLESELICWLRNLPVVAGGGAR